ncbi:MAG: MBL fold metallo-hydrolase [Nocardioidaceae bacterium]|nr:MBL fold metallo-hydrolase [Nocardioidaceae bacterium]
MSGGGARIERVVTSGSFNLDGGSWQVDNNVWLVGDDEEVAVIDASHDAAAIREAVGPRRVVAVVCTHGHDDHINAVGDLWDATKAPVWLHPADRMLWAELYEPAPDEDLVDGADIAVAGHVLTALHSPGHSPGSTCLYAPSLNAVFSGDTLFAGGPGATGRSYSDFDTIIESIRTRLLTLPADIVVHPGHGDTTTIGAEAPHLDAWIARGH